MDGRTITVKLVVRQRWWLRWYLAGVQITSRITGLEPDQDKVRYWLHRGAAVYVVR